MGLLTIWNAEDPDGTLREFVGYIYAQPVANDPATLNSYAQNYVRDTTGAADVSSIRGYMLPAHDELTLAATYRRRLSLTPAGVLTVEGSDGSDPAISQPLPDPFRSGILMTLADLVVKLAEGTTLDADDLADIALLKAYLARAPKDQAALDAVRPSVGVPNDPVEVPVTR